MTNSQTIKIAVSGCGYWGKNLIKAFAGLDALAAVSDANPDTASQFATQYNVPAKSWAELLADPAVTGIALATPAALHAPMALEALAAGKHLFVEKPLALTIPDAEKIIAAAAKQDRRLMVGHILNYHPCFTALKKLVTEGTLGTIRHIDSNRMSLGKIRHEENVLWSFAPHDLSMIMALTGTEPTSVTHSSNAVLQPGIADIGFIDLTFPNNVTAHIHTSWLSPFKEQRLTVIGDKGMAVFEDSLPFAEKLKVYPHGMDTTTTPPTLTKNDAVLIDVTESEPLRAECRHFVDCIANNTTPLTDGHEGLRVLRILAQTGQQPHILAKAA